MSGRTARIWTVVAFLVLGASAPVLAQNAAATSSELASVIKGNDGAEMVLIPAGDFWMGSGQAEIDHFYRECKAAANRGTGISEPTCVTLARPEIPRHRVTLDAFYMDRYEVTNALFEQFANATGYRTTAESRGHGSIWQQKDGRSQWLKLDGTAWRTPRGPGSSAHPRHPVVHISWHDADAYCRWAGKRLPTEAEWEKAARGGEDRRYPWGENWDASKANGDMAVQATAPVGSYPGGTSLHQLHDMAGNVWEWIADWFDAWYYEISPARNPKGPSSGQRKVLRGGSWHHDQIFLRSALRNSNQPDNHADNLGFRCAKSTP